MQNSNWVRRIKLQQLRVVLAVANSTSLVSASEQLGLSQPAVSKLLRDLEDQLGAELLVRTSRGSHPTPVGEILIERARMVFSQLDQVAREIHDAREGLSGHVVVGVLPAGGAHLLPRAMAALYQQHPGIRVTVIEGTYESLAPRLRQDTLDLIVGRIPAYHYREALEVEPLFQEQVTFAVRPDHPILTQAPVALANLTAWPWIMPPPDTTLRHMLESAFLEAGLELPQAPWESLSIITNRQLIQHTDVIGAFPAQVVEGDIATGMLAAVPMASPLTFGPVGITRARERPLSRAATRLAAALRASAATDGARP
ncbi:LysR substrate-binding domain-containing protein [Oceanobacter mangrovi]|uniref:LysR substrate-binding domain-containing protein n=1 Tax=Oceanobacter mangrovi TaxID=2862510 RepID=UPI001C8E39EC|nr:LysR substrate-binding domain-containing protein [Oceanobacter mangrovi]